MRQKIVPQLCAALITSFAIMQDAHACTDFVLTATDKSIINGRSMEFALPFESQLIVHKRGLKHQSQTPNEKKGISWTAKYGFVAVNGLNLDFVIDGINEKGLGFGALWLPSTVYQQVADEEASRAIMIEDFGTWVLSNFSTVDELKKALPQVKVCGHIIPALGSIPTLHFAIHDSQGNNLVVEYIDGALFMMDNPNSVLTNAPIFGWHLMNLRNYINLKAMNAGAVNFNGAIMDQTGQGSGLLGIPGDWTPPSRFVRTTIFKNFAETPYNAASAVNLAVHLLNCVDIPYGVVKEAATHKNNIDYTQWIVIKDLTNKQLYYRTYQNMTLRCVDMHKIDFQDPATVTPFTLDAGVPIVDITDQLMNKK